jgi:hypothetical protein
MIKHSMSVFFTNHANAAAMIKENSIHHFKIDTTPKEIISQMRE